MSVSNRQHLAALDEHRAIIRRQEREIHDLRDALRDLVDREEPTCTCTYDGPDEACPTHGRIACDRLFDAPDPEAS